MVIFFDDVDLIFDGFGGLFEVNFIGDILFGFEDGGIVKVFFEEFLCEGIAEKFNVLKELLAVFVFAALALLEGLSDGSLFGI
jgi:hypothetical protein